MRKNLINARQKAQLTQMELATKLNITVRHYQALEAGTSEGSVKVWRKLKDLLHKPIDYLLEQDTSSLPEKESEC